MFVLLALATLATIHTDFEGGRLGRIEQPEPGHFVCGVAGEKDRDGRNRQANWYFFRLDGVEGREIAIDLVDLPGEYNYRPNQGAVTGDTVPVFSYDRKTWNHFDRVEYDASVPRLRLRLKPAAASVWVAHVAPYTNEDLGRLFRELSRTRFFRVERAGVTPEGREIPLVTITDHGAPDASKRVVWLMFRQHSWEAGTSWVGEGAMRFLTSPDPAAARLRRGFLFRILPFCDPDGVARGGVRFNANGYDLNRNWDTVDPKLMPEIAAQRKAILDWVDQGRRIDLFLSLHNTETGEYLEGRPDPDVPFRTLAERFFQNLSAGTTFNPTRPLSFAETTTTAGKPGRMTVIQGLWRDRQITGFLMEQMIARNSKLGRLPEVADRLAFGADLIRAIALTLDESGRAR